MSTAPGPHHRLTDAEALACLAHADRPALLATATEAFRLAQSAESTGRAVPARNALLMAAAAVHLLLWGPLVPPGQAGRA